MNATAPRVWGVLPNRHSLRDNEKNPMHGLHNFVQCSENLAKAPSVETQAYQRFQALHECISLKS